MKQEKGTLYLIPCPIDEGKNDTLSVEVLHQLRSIKHFMAERSKTTRRFIKLACPDLPQNELEVLEIDKQAVHEDVNDVMKWLGEGKDVGIVSEAGCPGVADPGAKFVGSAHHHGFSVRPLVGPSSILLALMGSGLSGQSFRFCGYLPRNKDALKKALVNLELRTSRNNETQIFMETPYRNHAIFDAVLNTLQDGTKLCVAKDLTGDDEFIKTLRVNQWKKEPEMDLHKKPTIFVIGK